MAEHKRIEINNRRATYNYTLLQSYDAGIVLTGTEVKSLRDGKANLNDAFCYFYKGNLYIRNMHISEYKLGTYANHEPKRLRQLLLNARELTKIESKAKEKGFSVIPVRIFESDRGFFKVEISLAQGKKTYDKRNTIKNRDQKRELDRVIKK